MTGQLSELARKSIEPIVSSVQGGNVRAMQRFVSEAPWDEDLIMSKYRRLDAPLSFREEARVDLHPRISADGKCLCFDSSFSGVRSLSTMELPSE